MVISLAKILQMEPQSAASPDKSGNLRNPFWDWLKTAPNGTGHHSYLEYFRQDSNFTQITTNNTNGISYPVAGSVSHSEHFAMSGHATERETGFTNITIGNHQGSFDAQDTHFLNFAIISPLVFFAFLGLCALLLRRCKNQRCAQTLGNGDNSKDVESIQSGDRKQCQHDEEECEVVTIHLAAEDQYPEADYLGDNLVSTERLYASLKKLIGYFSQQARERDASISATQNMNESCGVMFQRDQQLWHQELENERPNVVYAN